MRIGEQVDSKSIAPQGVAGSSPVSSARAKHRPQDDRVWGGVFLCAITFSAALFIRGTDSPRHHLAAVPLSLVDRQIVIANGQGQDRHRGAVDPSDVSFLPIAIGECSASALQRQQ